MLFSSSLYKEVGTFKVMVWFKLLTDLFFFLPLTSTTNVFTLFLRKYFHLLCYFETGYAQMTSPIGKDKSPEFGSSSLSGVFSVEWIKKYEPYDYPYPANNSFVMEKGAHNVHAGF